MAWHFYLDESGQSKSTTPHAVFGGFGIAADKEEAFLREVKALFKACFGYAYEESFNLKGRKIFEKDRLKDVHKYQDMSDQDRRELAAELAVNTVNATRNIFKKKAAQRLSRFKIYRWAFSAFKET